MSLQMQTPWLFGFLFLFTVILFCISDIGKSVSISLAKDWINKHILLKEYSNFPRLPFLWVSKTFLAMGLICLGLSFYQTKPLALEVSDSQKSVDILFVVDVSLSMNAEDVAPNRLKQFQDTVLRLLPNLQGNRLGIVVFAGNAFSFCPMTSDLTAFSDYVKALGPDMIGEKGTDLEKAWRKTKEILESQKMERNRIVVFASDGEDLDSPKLEALPAKLLVWGFGTITGGRLAYRDEDTGFSGFVTRSGVLTDDPNSPYIINSQLREDILQQFALSNQGDYFPISSNPRDAFYLVDIANSLQKNDSQFSQVIQKEDGAWKFLLAAASFFLLEKFFRLFVKMSPLLLLILLLPFQGAQAENWGLNPGGDTVDKGIQAYKNQNFPESKNRFKEAEEYFPKDPRLTYNQGVAEYKNGDWETALQKFQESLASQILPESWKSKAYYNLGNAYAKKGDTKRATDAYEKALELQPDNLSAKKNLEWIRKKQPNNNPSQNAGPDEPSKEGNDKNSQANRNPASSEAENQKKSDKQIAEEMMKSYRPDSIMKRKIKGFPNREKDVFW